eukprot:scaffold434_cov358-Prasinococcus_capsulatus_cf.AAC.3
MTLGCVPVLIASAHLLSTLSWCSMRSALPRRLVIGSCKSTVGVAVHQRHRFHCHCGQGASKLRLTGSTAPTTF